MAFQLEASYLSCTVNQMSSFYMKCNTGLKWVTQRDIFKSSSESMRLIELESILCAYPNKEFNYMIFESFKAIFQGTVKTYFITHFWEVMT